MRRGRQQQRQARQGQVRQARQQARQQVRAEGGPRQTSRAREAAREAARDVLTTMEPVKVPEPHDQAPIGSGRGVIDRRQESRQTPPLVIVADEPDILQPEVKPPETVPRVDPPPPNPSQQPSGGQLDSSGSWESGVGAYYGDYGDYSEPDAMPEWALPVGLVALGGLALYLSTRK